MKESVCECVRVQVCVCEFKGQEGLNMPLCGSICSRNSGGVQVRLSRALECGPAGVPVSPGPAGLGLWTPSSL